MKKTVSALLALLLTLALCVPAFADATAATPAPSEEPAPTASPAPTVARGANTLMLGSTEFNGVFSPFFSRTAYDSEVSGLIQAGLWELDRAAQPVESLAYYQVPEVVKDADGKITSSIYTFKLKEGMKFSDGTPVTADDVMFSYYVFLDPTYDGASTMFALPIVGLNAYRYDDPNADVKVEEIKTKVEALTDDQVAEYIRKVAPADVEGAAFADVKDYFAENLGGEKGVAILLGALGATEENISAAQIADIYVNIELNAYFDAYREGAAEDYEKTLLESLKPAALFAGGEPKVPEIEGIKKIDDMTVQVTLNGVDPTAVYSLPVTVVPKAYYGASFKKGDLSGVKALNGAPIGAGSYKFVSFADNVVTLEANPGYFKGAPKLANIKYQVLNDADKVINVVNGVIDVSDPSCNDANVEQSREAGLYISMIPNNGYGYIGINSERIPDINVRKGLMHLMNREPSVKSYYKDRAEVIERPMSKVSWAYPADAKEVYGYDPARALEYFLAAGYTQVTEDGVTKLMKEGKQMHFSVCVGGGGIMDHPSAQVLSNMKVEMEKMGAVLDILDIAFNLISDGIDNGTFDMFCLAWQATPDPDMYQVYHSKGPTNHYRVKNAELDKCIEDARATLDIEERKALYARALDIVMDEAVEMPVYQRMNMNVFNPKAVNVDTLAKDMTSYYGFMSEIEKLEMMPQ